MALSQSFIDRCVAFPVSFTRDQHGKKTNIHMPEWKSLTQSMDLTHSANYALRTGDISGITVIDLDAKPDPNTCGVQWWERNMYPINTHPGIVVKSANGFHLYFAFTPDLLGLTGLFDAGVDIRNNGNLIFCGKGYTVMQQPVDTPADLPPVPPNFIQRYREYTQPRGMTHPNLQATIDPEIDERHVTAVSQFVQRLFAPTRHGPIMVSNDMMFMTIPLKSRDCQIAHRRHRSNHQYLVLTRDKLLYKCHDDQCTNHITHQYPDHILHSVNQILKPMHDELMMTCDGSDRDMAMCLHSMFKTTYPNQRLIAINQDTFFVFNGTRWHEADDASGEFAHIFDNMARKFRCNAATLEFQIKEHKATAANEALDANVREKAAELAKQLESQVKVLHSCAAKCSIRNAREAAKKMLSTYIRDSKFLEKLDTNTNIIAFNDCVLDLKTKETRPGQHDDYISKTVGYDFPTNVPTNDTDYVNAILTKIYPDPIVRKHALQVFSLSLSGHKGSEKMYFHTGVGANGKSVMNSVMLHVLGDYAKEMEAQRFCGYNTSVGAADAFLVSCRGCRYISISEPKDGCKFDSQTVKLWTSETIYCRQLYSGTIVALYPNRKVHCFCNAMPGFDGDTGMMRRPEKIPYISKFKDTELVDPENHVYLIDKNLLKNMDRIVPAFMQILIEHYDPEWDEQAPEIIRELTREYVEDNNEVGRFLDSVMEKSNDKADYILMADLFHLYEQYCTRKHKPRPQRGNFKNQLIAYIDAQRHGVFKDKHNVREGDKFISVRNIAKEWMLIAEPW